MVMENMSLLAFSLLAAYLGIAVRHHIDPCQMAIAWCLTRPFAVIPIIGATTLAQLAANIAAADLILSAELFEHYKPDPETYLGAAKLLGLAPEQVMMVAAHNQDLKAAQQLGLKTAFVARPTEYGPLQKYDFEATGNWDIVATDFNGIADKMGC